MFKKLKESALKPDGNLRVTTNNNNNHRSRTSSISSVNSQLNCSIGADADASAVVVSANRGLAVYDVSSGGGTRVADDAGRDSDTASIASSAFHSEAQLSELHTRFQHVHRLARGYKAKNQQLLDACKALERERDQLRELMEANQTKALRRMDELHEQLELDKKAKQDVEVNYRLMLSEKDEQIHVLRQQVALLKEGKDLPEELKERIQAGHARELERKRSLEQQNQELKLKVHELGLQLQLTTAQLEEHVLKREQLQQDVANLEKQQEQASKSAADTSLLQRQLTDIKLANSALEEQVSGLKEQLKSVLTSCAATAVKSSSTSDLVSVEKREHLTESQMRSLSEQLSDLKEKLNAEQNLRTNIEEELLRERQESQSNRTIIDELRASLDQHALQSASLTGELLAVKHLLEEKDKLLTNATNQVQLAEARESDLLAKLNKSDSNQNELELRVASLSSECETLRKEMDVIHDYVKAQLPRIKQLAPNLFIDDEADSSVVTSSTTASEKMEDLRKFEYSHLRTGIEKLVSVVNNFATKLAQLSDERLSEENRLITLKAQHIAEQELIVANQEQAHNLQLKELKAQFQQKCSALQQECDQKNELIEQLRGQVTERTNEVEQFREQLLEFQPHLVQMEPDVQSSTEDKLSLTNRCFNLKQLVQDLRKHVDELEEKNRDLTATTARIGDLQAERDDLARKLTEELAQKQHILAELDNERVRADRGRDQLTDIKVKLLSLNPVFQSVKNSLNNLREEWVTASGSASNQLQISSNILLRRLKSCSDSLTSDTIQASELLSERDKLQNEVDALRERIATLDHERDQANAQCMLLKEQLNSNAERFAELDHFREQHHQLESKQTELLAELAQIRLEFDNSLSAHQAEREQFDARNTQQEQSADAMRRELLQKQAELEQSQIHVNQMQTKLEALEQQLTSEQTATQMLRNELDRTRSDSTLARKDLMELEQKAMKVADDAAQYHERLTHMQEKVSLLEQRVIKFETIVRDLVSEQNTRMAEHRSSLSTAEIEVEKLRATVNKMDSELRSAHSSATLLVEQLIRSVETDLQIRLVSLKQAFSRPCYPGDDFNSRYLDRLPSIEVSLSTVTQELHALVQDGVQLSADTESPLWTLLKRFDAVSQELLTLEAHVHQRMMDELGEVTSLKEARDKAQLEVERLSEQCSAHVETGRKLEQRVSELNSELHDLTRTRQENEEKLSSIESVLAVTRQSLSATEAELQRARSTLDENAVDLEKKVTLISELENQLVDLRKVQQNAHSEIASKELECQRNRNDLSQLEERLASLVQQMESSQAEHVKEMHEIRLECDRQLESRLRETREEQTQLVKTHQSQLRAVQDSAGAKEKQLKQQLKDVKTRLKQVLQESENLRKSSVAAATKEQEATNRLAEAETELAQSRSRCEQLTETIEKQNTQVAALQQSLEQVRQEVRSPPPTIIDEVREQYQKETESLKAEHALHTQDMHAEFKRQLQAREAELHTEFEKQLATAIAEAKQAQSELSQQRQQFADSVDDANRENESLRLRVEELESQLKSFQLASNARPDADSMMVSSSSNDQSELQRLRDEVERLTAQLQSTTPTGDSKSHNNTQLMEELTVHTEHITPMESKLQASVYPNVPHEPLVQPKSSNWVEQLRNEILHAESIDSLHPAVRSTQYLPPISVEEYQALQCHNADLQNQLQQLSADFEALRASCCAAHNGPHTHHTPSGLLESGSLRQFNFPPSSPSLASPSVGSLQELVEYEYLRNVLFEYMIGRETPTLAKVLCSILRFNSEQTKKVLQYEDIKSRTWTIRTVMD